MYIFISLLCFETQFQSAFSQSFQLMNPEEQIKTFQVIINDQDYQFNDDAFLYGMWSRYNPLFQIAQVGSIGLFDSNCFNYHNFVGKKSKLINLVFYVCLNADQSTIIQTLQFRDDQNKEHIYSVSIEPNYFENVWSYFQIIQWPLIEKFQLLIKQSDQEIFFKELTIKYPFYDKELIATFGGGADFVFGTLTMAYSYFPGSITYIEPDINTVDPLGDIDFSYFEDKEIENKKCELNSQTNVIRNLILKGSKIVTFPSSNANVEYFQFVGWFKITSKSDDEILYKVIKITTNSKNNKVTDDNLSPFCLFYKISAQGNQIIVTTYSYDFPIINMDFNQNSFLITKEFDIVNNIYAWNYVKVTLQNNELYIEITFYDEDQNYSYETTIQVQQFHRINFQIQIGNVEERIDNQLNIIADEVYFSNCDSHKFEQACHYSCDQCIGPTSSDCISCKEDSWRVSLSDFHQCICPYYSIDDIECRTLLNLNLQVGEILNNEIDCKYGYFKANGSCFECPLIVNIQQINCLECLNNPKNWINMLYCETYIVSQNGQTFQQYQDKQTIYETTISYFTFDGVQINFCEQCTSSCIDEECLFHEFRDITKQKVTKKAKSCEGCKDNNCEKDCAYCDSGICIACYPPFYLTSDKLSCKACSIHNCQYCFEYRSDDLTQSTLYKTFKAFYSNDQSPVQLGCSLCYQGFNYNFLTGKCVYGQPGIQNCGRSFIDLQGNEVCVLSTVNDFNIAPQLSNCQQYISNCKQCVLTPTKVIKCVLCADGFVVSVIKGDCELCNIENSLTCIQGDSFYYDYWVQSIQSFMMQFLPDNYFYPKPILQYYIIAFPLTCITGYMPNRYYKCIKYCDSDCQLCEEVDYEFVCKVCPLNYYGQPILSRSENKCLQCSQLCYTCQPRSLEEIALINPYYVTAQDNIFYSHKCLKAIEDDNVVIDSEIQIAKYCFDNLCDGTLEREIIIYCNYFEGLNDENYDVYYQNDVSVEFYNQMGMKNFILTLQFQQIGQCDILQILEMTIILKQLVFSLMTTSIHLIGLQNQGSQWNQPLDISNFDSILFENFNLVADPLTYIQVFNDILPIDLQIIDSTFQGWNWQTQVFRFQIQLYKNLVFSNVTLQYLNLTDLSFIEYKSNKDEEIINFNQLLIQQCNFQNITLFSFLKYAALINIKLVEIKDCIFINSTLFKYNENSTQFNTLNSIVIKNCQFESSILFSSTDQPLNIINMIFYNNTFSHSTVIQSQTYINVTDVMIQKCSFLQSLFFQSIKQSTQTSAMIVQSFINFTLKQINFNKSKIIEVVTLNNYIIINLANFTQTDLVNYGQQKKYLYDFQCQNLSITDFKIYNSMNLQFLRVYQTMYIIAQRIFYINLVQSNKITIDESCFQYSDIHTSLLFIQGLSEIIIKNVSIINQLAIDFPIIQIQSDLLFQPSKEESIIISDVSFFGNILLKQSIGSILSLFTIYSERAQQIQFNNFSFQENFFHQIIDDSSESISGLIYVNSKLSNLSVNNIQCSDNGITNSSNPFIYINTLKILIFQFQTTNSNQISDQIWAKYYQINALGHIQLLMEQLFILNSGGICSLLSQNISFVNSQFTNIKALSTSVLNIITSGQGIVKLLNMTIHQASVTLSQTIEVFGCININSKNSKLYLQVADIYLEEVYNRLGPAIFSMDPSLLQNHIEFLNITIMNCFSLLNQIMDIEFSQIQAKKNQFKLQLLTFQQTVEGLDKYLQQIIFPSTEEIKKMISDNAILNLQQCSVILNQIYVTGILYSPIFKLNYLIRLTMQNVIIENIQAIYPFTLVVISSTSLAKSNLFLSKIFVINASQINTIQTEPTAYPQSINFTFDKCFLDEVQVYSNINDQTLNNLIIRIHQNGLQTGSIIKIEALSNSSNLRMRQIDFLNNNCTFCYEGMLQIKAISFPSIMMEDINCYNNLIKKYGCIQFSTDNYLDNQENLIMIKNSVFIKNNGSSGVGIFSQNILLSVINCVFYNNFGTENGGAIYFQNISNEFLFINTIITRNLANIGGGIHLSPKNYLTSNNFKTSILLFNKAKFYSDNLVQIPSHLTLIINKKEMPSIQEEQNLISLQNLQLSPYKCIDQTKSIETNKLMLPSNQIINNYMLFNKKERNYLPYIQEINLVYKNAMNEFLEGDLDDTCSILRLKYRQNDIESSQITQVLYNPQIIGFDLGDISIQMDPYNKNQTQFQLQINCSSSSYIKEFYYKINVRAFICQLGEFYVDEGCQICDPKQGFYSVTYNTTKCSIFDSTKFDNITSNLIKLKSGYWRPYYDSDQIESCFKNQNWCLGGWSVRDNLCYSGHVGGLCEECDIYNTRGLGNFFKISNTTCQICNISYSWVSFILISLWSFTSVLITLKSLKNSNRLFLKLKLKTKFFLIVFKQSQDFQSILVKMFLNYLWIFSVIFTFNINFGVSLNFIDEASKPTYSMAINLDCLLSEILNIQLSYIRIIAMLIFIMIQLILVAFIQLYISIKEKENYDCSIISNTVIYLYVFNQASLITMFGSLLAVRRISGINYVQGDVTMQFYNQNHLDWINIFIIPGLVIWGAFFPLIIFYLLKQGSKKLNQYRFRRHVCYLYNEYVSQKYFWEQIKIWKRSIIIIILVYFESSVPTKAFLISFTLLLYQYLAIHNEPYITKKLNSYDVKSGQIVSGTILLAALKYISEQTQPSLLSENAQIVSIILQVLIFLLCLWLSYYFMVSIVKAYFKKYDQFLLNSLFNVISKIKKNSKIATYLNDTINTRKVKQEQLQANFDKLREYLLLTSKFQLEQQKNNSPLRSKRHIRLLTEMDTQRMLLHSKSIFSPKDLK